MDFTDFKVFFESHYKAPVLRHKDKVDPDDVKYYGGMKSAAKYMEKQNETWRKDYEKAVGIRDGAIAAYAEMSEFPADVADFFYSSFVKLVEDDIGRLERKRAAHDDFVKAMDGNKTAVSCAERLLGNGKITSRWDAEKGTDIPVLMAPVSEIEWLMCGHKMNDAERERWAALAIGYREAYFAAKDAKGAVENLLFCATLCKREADNMKRVLGGIPDGFERLEGWGVGGKFNGIVRRGDKRASFKSFLAGGYNIQRLHMRTKVTLLK